MWTKFHNWLIRILIGNKIVVANCIVDSRQGIFLTNKTPAYLDNNKMCGFDTAITYQEE